jgi:2-polyprenyl-6-methoxyphenol hydroxylase-like FAD-dependent oxidoreductase
MQEQQFDVIVVGAGIAGCTAATLFARRGLNLALVERNADCKAYKRMCTHFIQASAVPTIRRLGLDKAIETSGGIPNRIDLWTRWGWIRGEPHNAQGEPTHGYNIRRKSSGRR